MKYEDELLKKFGAIHQHEIKNRDFGKEILKTMPYAEAKEFLTPFFESRLANIKEFQKQYKKIKKVVCKYHAPDTIEFNFCVDAIWLLRYSQKDIENQAQLQNIESLYIWNESRKSRITNKHTSSFQDKTYLIGIAKQIPIETFFKNFLKQSGNSRLVGLCPFRQEKNPSFTIFTDTNTFYCFGCLEHGDVITFYQKLYGLSFWEVVKQLAGDY